MASGHTLVLVQHVASLTDAALSAGGGRGDCGVLAAAIQVPARWQAGRRAGGIPAVRWALQSCRNRGAGEWKAGRGPKPGWGGAWESFPSPSRSQWGAWLRAGPKEEGLGKSMEPGLSAGSHSVTLECAADGVRV